MNTLQIIKKGTQYMVIICLHTVEFISLGISIFLSLYHIACHKPFCFETLVFFVVELGGENQLNKCHWKA